MSVCHIPWRFAFLGLVLVTSLTACAPPANPWASETRCAAAMGLRPVDRAWLQQEQPYGALVQRLQTTRSLSTRRRLEAIIACYRAGDEVWVWDRSTWIAATGEQFSAGSESGYALVRSGAVIGGVQIDAQSGETIAQ